MCVAFFAMKGYTQDSLVNYLDRKGEISKKEQARYIETIVRKDSLWLVRRYFANGKIFRLGKFKHKAKKQPIGEFLEYYSNGHLKKKFFYNDKSLKSNWIKNWFYTGKLSHSGNYRNGKREGIWKFYHSNGNMASKLYYKNEHIVKSVIYDEQGAEIKVSLIRFKKATFIGGLKEFKKKIQILVNSLGFKIKGKIHVNFIINGSGEISNIAIEEQIAEKYKKEIISYFQKIKGWSPAIHMNRKYFVNHHITLSL